MPETNNDNTPQSASGDPSGDQSGAALWEAADMQASDAWQLKLTDADRDELRAAVRASASADVATMSRDDFPLDALDARLSAAHTDIVNGRGFVLVRGVPVNEWTRLEALRAYMGIALRLGTPVSQNGKGHLIGHVTDIGNDPKDPAVRVYTTSWRQPFHTDSCDIVGLLCLNPARRGGASSITSSTSVVAELRRTRPDLAQILEQPFIYDRKNEIPEGHGPWYPMPVVHRHAGKTSVFYARDFIDAAMERFPDVASLSEQQREALDTFDALASSDRFRFDMDFQSGDIQFLHNHQILHARTSYEDFQDPAKRRHLLRVWLSAHDPRALPAVYEQRYGAIRPGQIRGGIRVPGVQPVVPLEAS